MDDWYRRLQAAIDVRDFDDDGHFHEYFEPADRERLIQELERMPRGSRSLRRAVEIVNPELVDDDALTLLARAPIKPEQSNGEKNGAAEWVASNLLSIILRRRQTKCIADRDRVGTRHSRHRRTVKHLDATTNAVIRLPMANDEWSTCRFEVRASLKRYAAR